MSGDETQRRATENDLREIGFYSKPISVIYHKEETYLKMGVGSDSRAMKGGK